MFGLDELTAVVPPPALPSVTTRDSDWLQVYSLYGTRLPGDFIHTCKAYGNGAFCSVTHRWTAEVDLYNHSAFWMKEVPACLWEIRDIRERYPKRVPFPFIGNREVCCLGAAPATKGTCVGSRGAV
jgi:hypothetical protein